MSFVYPGALKRTDPQEAADISEEGYDYTNCQGQDERDGLWPDVNGVHDRCSYLPSLLWTLPVEKPCSMSLMPYLDQ